MAERDLNLRHSALLYIVAALVYWSRWNGCVSLIQRNVAPINEIVPTAEVYAHASVSFWILTYDGYVDTRCNEILDSWAYNFQYPLYFYGTSTEFERSGAQFKVIHGADAEEKAKKELLAWKHLYDTTNYDWYVKGDDDTLFLPDNMAAYLHTLNPAHPWYLGRKFQMRGLGGLPYHSGGAGYVLSRHSLRLMMSVLDRCLDEFCFGDGDVAVGLCLSLVGVVAEDTRVLGNRERFFPFASVSHLTHFQDRADDPDFWYFTYNYGPFPREPGAAVALPNETLSFHYMEGQMRHWKWPVAV